MSINIIKTNDYVKQHLNSFKTKTIWLQHIIALAIVVTIKVLVSKHLYEFNFYLLYLLYSLALMFVTYNLLGRMILS
jgi:hypothetical protein